MVRSHSQVLPSRPRTLTYSADANKFGAAYLQKLGWSAGTGLGTEGDGRTTHIKVEQKLDMLGIGAAHQRDPNGLAWKQNRDFENLLKRLNNGGADVEKKGTKVDGFARATEEDNEGVTDGKEDKKEKKKRKRHEKDEEKVDEEAEKKKDKKKRKKEKKERKEKEAETETDDEEPEPAPSIPTPTPRRPYVLSHSNLELY